MSKILEVEGEIEKILISIFDAALKSGGWSMIQSIDMIRNAIKLAEGKQADPAQSSQPSAP